MVEGPHRPHQLIEPDQLISMEKIFVGIWESQNNHEIMSLHEEQVENIGVYDEDGIQFN